MARVYLPESQPMYAAAARIVDAVLRHDGAIFTPGQPIWTQTHVDDLYRRFVEAPDVGDRTFLEKFRDQLRDAPAAVYQLAGELLFIHLLVVRGNMGAPAKRDLIATVLGWSPAPVVIPAEDVAALEGGLARVGTAYMTYRPFQLAFLLRFIRDWKRLDAAEQARLLGDPWAFKQMLFAIPIEIAYAQREAVLHLVHPDAFEAIVSRDHKQEYVRKFAAFVTTPTDDVDRALAQIRAAVDARYGPGLPLSDVAPPAPTILPRSLGDRLQPYVALVARLGGSNYTAAQILYRAELPASAGLQRPSAETLVADLCALRLLKRIDASGNYRRWSHLDDGSEALLLRYAALTLLVDDGHGGYVLPILHAPFDGMPHPEHEWPHGRALLAWYEEAGLVQQGSGGLWRSLPDALEPRTEPGETAQAVNTFLAHLHRVRASQHLVAPDDDAPLPMLESAVLETRIADLQRELLIDRMTLLRIYRALLAGQHVMLSGPPGTGKTHLAHLLPRLLWRDTAPTVLLTLPADPALPPTAPPIEQTSFRDGYAADVVTATEDWGVRHMLGGIAPYLMQDGETTGLGYQTQRGYLTRTVLSNYGIGDSDAIPAVLRRAEVTNGTTRHRGRWLVIDEFTRAPIDAAFGSLLTTLGGQGSPLMVPTDTGDVAVPMPRDFRIIGTLNSVDRHFLNQMSEAMKRRFTFIDVLPPGPELADAEAAIALYRALVRLHEQGVPDISIQPERADATWEGVVQVTTDASGRRMVAFAEGAQGGLAAQAFDSLWRLIRMVRVYRQLGTAQIETACGALLSGHLVGMEWPEALDSALADTLADQLQVLGRDEQRVLIAYLHHAAAPDTFAVRVRDVLAELPAARQRAHLALLGLRTLAELDEATLGRAVALGSPLLITGTGWFARRLSGFLAERGL